MNGDHSPTMDSHCEHEGKALNLSDDFHLSEIKNISLENHTDVEAADPYSLLIRPQHEEVSGESRTNSEQETPSQSDQKPAITDFKHCTLAEITPPVSSMINSSSQTTNLQPLVLTPVLLQQILAMQTGIVANQNVIQITVPQDALLQSLPQLTATPPCVNLVQGDQLIYEGAAQSAQVVFAELEALQSALNKITKEPHGANEESNTTVNSPIDVSSFMPVITPTPSFVHSYAAAAGSIISKTGSINAENDNDDGDSNQPLVLSASPACDLISDVKNATDSTLNSSDHTFTANESTSIDTDPSHLQMKFVNLSGLLTNPESTFKSNSNNTCNICNKSFESAQALKGHMAHHMGKVTKCPICKKLFSRNWLLQGHLRIHTGERPYPCTFSGCSKAFADKSNLRSHMLIHTTTSKVFVCDKCNKAFAQKRYLHKHRLEVCSKRKDLY